jgi:ribosomal protein L11 methylase PrmA
LSAAARLRLTFFLPDAAAEWAGAALPDLFPDGLLLIPKSGGVTCLKGWLPIGKARMETAARQRLSSLGATRISAVLQRPQPPKALHGRFPVLRLGRFVVLPASLAKAPRLSAKERPIRLVQGQAFGTGLHQSTRLMLAQLEMTLAPGLGVLDVGAGSGILGFGALHLGASKVTCVELESAACAELRENRALNSVPARRMPVICGRYPLARLRGKRYPVVLGNLVTPLLLALMPDLAGQLAKGGSLLCSGIHTRPEATAVTAAAKARGMKSASRASLDDWHVLRFVRA